MKHHYWYNIIFSNEHAFRWKRHFLFWIAVFLYHLIRIGIMYPPLTSSTLIFSLLGKAFWWGLTVNMIMTYAVVYWLIPRYFVKKKYMSFVILLVSMLLVISTINITIDSLLNPLFRRSIGYSFAERLTDLRPGLIRIMGNPPLILGLFLSIKTLKNWHLEQLKTETLGKENANAELQLLKAQIHPHFLFNTLNNIYSFSLYRSPQAGALVKKLSGMLGYMINECDEKFVSLKKELSLVKDYMGLEKVRYGKRLDMQVEIDGDFENKMIAPLLMVPFIENSFKHGTSQMLRHPWIKLEITTVKNQLFLKLSNSRPSIISSPSQKGIGLLNVKKRLELLYPGKHQLDISTTENIFTVNMQILIDEDEFASNNMKTADAAFAYN